MCATIFRSLPCCCRVVLLQLGVVMFRDSRNAEGATQADHPPQQLKYGDTTHTLQSSSESHRCELYKSSGAGSDDAEFEFAGLIHHSLTVQKVEDVTAGVDSALQQLRSSMAAISEVREANKYASPVFPGRSHDLLQRSRDLLVVIP